MGDSYQTQKEFLVDLLDQPGTIVNLFGDDYEILFAGQPTPRSGGECKTDCYVALRSVEDGEEFEYKISYKTPNSYFAESKLSPARAEDIFGNSWPEIIWNCAAAIGTELNNRPIVFFSGAQEGSFTLGWRCDLVTDPSGELVAPLFMMRSQKLEAYTGSNFDESKRDCYVNGTIIPDSGVANSYLEIDLVPFMSGTVSDIEEILNALIPIDDENISALPDLYLVFKALNYRSFEGAWDGSRPLAVAVEWFVNSKGQLDATLLFFDAKGGTPPLVTGGNESAGMLLEAMEQLGITTTDDLYEDNFSINVPYKE